MNYYYKKIKEYKNKNIDDSNIVIKLSESCNISLEESYNSLKEYNNRQELINKTKGFTNSLTDFGKVNEYGIPMLEPGEEW